MIATDPRTPTQTFVGSLLGRRDYAIISSLVEPGSKVLDLGCGDGELLAWLAENKQVVARGVEISATRVQRCIAQGLSVYQANGKAAGQTVFHIHLHVLGGARDDVASGMRAR